jgi:hypothetical protein
MHNMCVVKTVKVCYTYHAQAWQALTKFLTWPHEDRNRIYTEVRILLQCKDFNTIFNPQKIAIPPLPLPSASLMP